MRNFIHTIAIIALILAVVSPACKFISGQLIEICAADGTMKSIIVSPENAPPELPGKHTPPKQDNSCAFCFAQSHIKSIAAGAAQLLFYFLLISMITAAWISSRYKRFELSALSARAPPLL